MKKLNEIKAILSKDKQIIQKKYHVTELGIFGSYVRGEQKEDSDLDVLIDYAEAPNLLELLDLEFYLSDILGIKADVVTKKGLKHRYRKRILAEVVYV
ncbi:MAG: nucleotidyltransferase family protein [Cyanobacteria bacterium P01_F01_bin.143]